MSFCIGFQFRVVGCLLWLSSKGQVLPSCQILCVCVSCPSMGRFLFVLYETQTLFQMLLEDGERVWIKLIQELVRWFLAWCQNAYTQSLKVAMKTSREVYCLGNTFSRPKRIWRVSRNGVSLSDHVDRKPTEHETKDYALILRGVAYATCRELCLCSTTHVGGTKRIYY